MNKIKGFVMGLALLGCEPAPVMSATMFSTAMALATGFVFNIIVIDCERF